MEPDQMGERRIVVRKPAELPLLNVAYHVPRRDSADYYSLNILRTILFHGESSRLYSRLVDKDQVALSVDDNMMAGFDPGLEEISIQPKQGVDPQLCEKELYEELQRVTAELVTDAELQKAKNIRLSEFYHQIRTINGRANTIGAYEVFFGDYHKLFDAAKNYSAVTREDVQRVAKTYLGPNNRTVATLIPDNQEKAKQ
jgi:predicted Zn-dependent peptidase